MRVNIENLHNEMQDLNYLFFYIENKRKITDNTKINKL